MVNETITTITVSWMSVPCDADGYVVNVASDTHTVTQQVKGASHIINTVCVSKSYGESSTYFYNTTEEMMSLICTVTNDISTLYCNILTYVIVLLQVYLLMY